MEYWSEVMLLFLRFFSAGVLSRLVNMRQQPSWPCIDNQHTSTTHLLFLSLFNQNTGQLCLLQATRLLSNPANLLRHSHKADTN